MKKIDPRFEKFANKKSNAAVKEAFKQEKRKHKKEKAAFFEQKKKEGVSRIGNTAAPKIERPVNLDAQMPLNKYLAHCGVSSRRDAAELIKQGNVKVNGEVLTEPGYKMADGDKVTVNGKPVHLSVNLVYILLNKPKDYITTTDDPQKRKTVLDLIKRATFERVYPVGRLDRNTSGVLLITNDGELAQKLTHPSNEVKKIYAVTLDKPLEKNDFEKIIKGVVLEDGPAPVDALAYSDAKDKTQIGIEIHSGRNRIVRRIFESLGYDVRSLDRVMFAGLTKKNVERGKYRFLKEKEIRNLKYLGKERGGGEGSWKKEARSGKLGEGSLKREARSGKFGEGSLKKEARSGELGEGSWKKEARSGKLGEGSLKREARSGKLGEGSWEKEARSGKLGEGSLKREARSGKLGEGSLKREARSGELGEGSWKKGARSGKLVSDKKPSPQQTRSGGRELRRADKTPKPRARNDQKGKPNPTHKSKTSD